MGFVNAINTAQVAANTMTPSAESLKASGMNTCRGAISHCRGTGSITIGVKNAIGDASNAAIGTATSSLQACTQLLTLQPINATCTALKGATEACKNVTKAITSPIPIALAVAGQSVSAAKTGVHATKEVVKAVAMSPITVPTRAIEVVGGGIAEVEKMFGVGGASSAAPANDNAEKASATPPPMAKAA